MNKRFLIIITLFIFAFIMCGAASASVVTNPNVTSMDPVNNSINVPTNKVIKVIFNEDVKIGNGWIELKKDGSTLPINKTISDNTLTITHTQPLNTGTKYMIALHTGSITDLSGNSLNAYVSRFTTDGTPPTVRISDPTNNEMNVVRNKVIKVTFSEPVKWGTWWIELKNSSGNIIPITKSITGNVLTINHATLLKSNTKYNICFHTGSVKDYSSNPLVGCVRSFTTSTIADITAPTVTSIDPTNNEMNVVRNKVIKVTFSEPVKWGTWWIELKNSSGNIIPITKSITGNVLTINHATLLKSNTKYNICFHTGSVKDYSSNPLAGCTRSFTTTATDYNINPPSSTAKLIFIHHSCGQNWLSDSNGGLGVALRDNNYFVSDTNYGWGPDGIGSSTDTSDWPTWFLGPNSDTYMSALYSESGQNSDYSRFDTVPSGENEIIMFKSCYPSSEVGDSIDDEKSTYNSLKTYFAAHPEKLFILITPPGETNVESYQLTRELCNWLVDKDNGWLAGYTEKNVFTFDFYGVLSEVNSHHRYVSNSVEHIYASDYNGNSPYHDGDDHPNAIGNQKATNEFITLLNIAYNQWKS